MSNTNLFIRLTHTGVFPGGRPNQSAILIPDLDVGYEYQWRKVPVYVPFEMPVPAFPPGTPGFINIPASSRSMLSFDTGAIFKATTAGLLLSKFFLQPEVYSNITRPSAIGYPAGTSIWNTSDNTLNWSDGAGAWRDQNGVIT
jgi:hypothetical protein